MARSFLLGVDLGGTKIAAAAFDLAGNRLGKIARLPTMATMQPAVTLLNLKRVVKQAKAEAGAVGNPLAVGMGSTGPLDTRNKILRDRDSLPHLDGFRIGKFSEDELGAPLYLENDAGCFALGEAVRGAGRGMPVVVGVTLGTGFGCGIVVEGKLYSGATSNAGEVAYCRVGDSDFDHACAAPGVRRAYARHAGVAEGEAPNAREIGDRANNGDRAALRAWSEFGASVGTAVGMLCCVLDPHVVVLGGSISRRLTFFEEPLLAAARAVLPNNFRDSFGVVLSELGDAAGLTGAAEHARQQMAQ